MAAAPRGNMCFHVQLVLRAGTAPGAAQGMGLLLGDGLAGARELPASTVSLHTRQRRQAREQVHILEKGGRDVQWCPVPHHGA